MSTDRETVKLMNALGEAYKALLRQPQTAFRINNQSLYAHVRDALAELHGTSSEETQNYFTSLVLDEDDEFGP